MDEGRTIYKKLPIESISLEARLKYEKLEPNIKEMYRTDKCQLCAKIISIKQMNEVIIEGVPPICKPCYENMITELDKLAPLFNQLGLF